jgi:2,3-diketo-5-methylthio-1-phosphopentane phosphatase
VTIPKSEKNNQWLIVTDFDGTLTQKDIGNELCDEILGPKWHAIYAEYRSGKIDLKEYQKKTWNRFPLGEAEFIQRSLRHAYLRSGVDEFLKAAALQKIPVFVASCGLRPYIEATLKKHLSAEALSAIHGIRCNEVSFSSNAIHEFIPPITSDDCPFPLDKGAYAREMAAQFSQPVKILGIGNGTSDQSFWGAVEQLAAIESLEKWCQSQSVPHVSFVDFFDLRSKVSCFDEE